MKLYLFTWCHILIVFSLFRDVFSSNLFPEFGTFLLLCFLFIEINLSSMTKLSFPILDGLSLSLSAPNLRAVLSPVHRGKLLITTPQRNPPPPGLRIIFSFGKLVYVIFIFYYVCNSLLW